MINPDHVVVFFREEGFYPIELESPKKCGMSLREQAAKTAEINPGTLRVEDVRRNVLWSLQ